MNARGTVDVLSEVLDERERQHAKWGEQNHPDGTGDRFMRLMADGFRAKCEHGFATGVGSWALILQEELYEALAESNVERLREELVQAAAVALAWVEAIDRRRSA